MTGTVWRNLRSLLPSQSRLSAAVVVVESFVAGLLEALLLVIIVRIALNIADDQGDANLRLPLFGQIDISSRTALIMATGAGLVVLALHIHIARSTALLAASVLEGARMRAIGAFARASWSRQSRDREGALQETTSTLATQTALILIQMSTLVVSLIGLVTLLATAAFVSLAITAIVLGFGVILFLGFRPIGRLTRARARRFVRMNSQFTEEMSQWGTLAMELRIFGVEETEKRRLTVANREVAHAYRRSRFMSRLGSSLYRDVAILFLVGAVGILAVIQNVDIAAVGAVVLLIVRSLGYAQNAHTALQGINEQSPNLDSLLERLGSLEAEFEKVGSIPLSTITHIRLANVGYDYEPGRPGIRDISIDITAGEALGVIGPSGGGKSTLVQVLLRLRPPTQGSVTVSDIPYQEIEPNSWHRLVALVSQEPKLFQGTVAENIAFLRSGFTRTQVEMAAASAHVRDDILHLPNGFDTQLGSRGSGLSGGQKQRIAIARALIGAPQLLVLDEPTSALDVRSEQLLQETIEELKGRVTLIIIAHRLTTLACCDRVIAMRDGSVETIGTLDEALAHLSFTQDLLDPARRPPAG